MTGIETARAQLRGVAHDLENLKLRLLGIRAGLPSAASEVGRSPEGEESGEMDPRTELRTVIECVLHDCLEPALAGLLAEASAPPSC